MKKFSGKSPSLKNSKSVGQGEKQKARKKMNAGQGMTANTTIGGAADLQSSTAVGNSELQNAKKKVKKSGSKNPNSKGLM